MTLDATTIEEGLQERWERHGHNIAYLVMSHRDEQTGRPVGTILHCTECLIEVQVHVNELGGWWLSNHDLDKECGA